MHSVITEEDAHGTQTHKGTNKRRGKHYTNNTT